MAGLTVDHLRRDHQEARKVMARFESLLAELDVDADPRLTPERRAILDAVRSYICGPLVLLIRKKDEILYPALDGLFPLHEGPLAVLQDEHKSLTTLFGDVCRAGKSLGNEESPEVNLQALCRPGRKGMELLLDHLYKEEKVLFPMVARHLTPERDEELLKRMESLSSIPVPH